MTELQIQYNKEVLNKCKQFGLSLDFIGTILLILFSLYEEKYDVLDSLDNNNKDRKILMLYQYLHRKDLIYPTDSEDDILYRLTDKGLELVNYCTAFGSNSFVTEDKQPTIQDEKSDNPEDVSSWIEEWIEIFPKGKVDGKYLRTGKHECSDRMRWFIKQYNYPKDVIFAATKSYIEFQESSQHGHMYTRNSSYFIFKGRSKEDRTSDLATWCSRVETTDLTNKEYIERDAV